VALYSDRPQHASGAQHVKGRLMVSSSCYVMARCEVVQHAIQQGMVEVHPGSCCANTRRQGRL